jgi:hypothetical protein
MRLPFSYDPCTAALSKDRREALCKEPGDSCVYRFPMILCTAALSKLTADRHEARKSQSSLHDDVQHIKTTCVAEVITRSNGDRKDTRIT